MHRDQQPAIPEEKSLFHQCMEVVLIPAAAVIPPDPLPVHDQQKGTEFLTGQHDSRLYFTNSLPHTNRQQIYALLQQLLRMFFRIHLLNYFGDLSLLINNKCGTQNAHVFFSEHHFLSPYPITLRYPMIFISKK